MYSKHCDISDVYCTKLAEQLSAHCELIERPLTLVERGPTKERVLEKIVDFVDTFIQGVAA